MIVLRCQKNFDESNGKRGIGIGTKLALGAGTVAGTFYGAKKGFLGNNAMLTANKAWARVGNRLGSQSMMNSGVAGIKEGMGRKLTNKMTSQVNNTLAKNGRNLSESAMNKVNQSISKRAGVDSSNYANSWVNRNLSNFNPAGA